MYKKMLVSLCAVLAFTAAGAVTGSNEGVQTASAASVQSGGSAYDAINEKAGSSLVVAGDIPFEYPGSAGVTLRGSVRLPDAYKAGQTYPVAILSHGVLGDRNQQGMFTQLTDALQKKGFVTVRFDFNGYGESGGTLLNNSIKSEKEDLDAIINYVKTLNYVDQSRINLVGYSMGGAATSLAAGERAGEIRSVALWSAAAILVDDAERGSLLGAQVDVNNIPNEIPIFGGAYTFGKKWFEDAIGLDIYGISKAYEGDVLIVHGTKDVVVPMSYSEKYKEVYGKGAKLVRIKGGEHVYSGEPLDTAVKRTVNFLYKENKRKK
ncbi:alpha/beta hydrolase family protein [Saccharibacillus alkalitolerans]|uniref:Alpha/beta hydrolase n=1 Tax=Saccharibacillus alkalitolerans TaxID=2705290 RepID=A0ABX0FE52_9BACL|nr:alpha/beta fold hydrolase [Saccharibacillus alkalitolerans]NGZ76947.1 alpha/beta hydrolase [Saccharibacillus alkalitolerans]